LERFHLRIRKILKDKLTASDQEQSFKELKTMTKTKYFLARFTRNCMDDVRKKKLN
jgi:hypothetical protein